MKQFTRNWKRQGIYDRNSAIHCSDILVAFNNLKLGYFCYTPLLRTTNDGPRVSALTRVDSVCVSSILKNLNSRNLRMQHCGMQVFDNWSYIDRHLEQQTQVPITADHLGSARFKVLTTSLKSDSKSSHLIHTFYVDYSSPVCATQTNPAFHDRLGLKLTRASFCRVNTANPGSKSVV